jgi:hypothetical protein
MEKKVVIGLAIFLFAIMQGVFAIEKCDYGCLIPDSLNDTTKEIINPSFGNEPSLQHILNKSFGYNVSVVNDQTNIQVWHVLKTTTFEIKYLGKVAAASQVFGYYLNGNKSTFIPLFEAGDNPFFNETIANVNDTFFITVLAGNTIGFSMDSYGESRGRHRYYTENNLNLDLRDHVIVIDLCAEFLLGFENAGEESDFQDLVVSVKPVKCESLCPREESFGLETPGIWMRNSTRIMTDDNTEPGRISYGSEKLVERINNYAFEGEKINYQVLVVDSNGVENIGDVYFAIGNDREYGDIEANCRDSGEMPEEITDFNVRVNEEDKFCFNEQIMKIYNCTLTVETPESMYGEYFVKAIVEDDDGNINSVDENEYWFFNPVVAISVDGDLTFENIREGTQSYSQTVLVGNDADDGSGVMLDMFISGTDFYDSSSSGAKCPDTNQLALDNFAYYGVNGAYSSKQDTRSDDEGYLPIGYGIGFNDPNPFYDNNEVLQVQQQGPYYVANLLAPGAEMALTFRLDLPEPCNGDFDSGQIFFWGEAI